jgi:hypothetical protein
MRIKKEIVSRQSQTGIKALASAYRNLFRECILFIKHDVLVVIINSREQRGMGRRVRVHK